MLWKSCLPKRHDGGMVVHLLFDIQVVIRSNAWKRGTKEITEGDHLAGYLRDRGMGLTSLQVFGKPSRLAEGLALPLIGAEAGKSAALLGIQLLRIDAGGGALIFPLVLIIAGPEVECALEPCDVILHH